MGFSQDTVQRLTPVQVDEVVGRLQAAVRDYVFPDIATKLQAEIEDHRAQYRTVTNPAVLAERLTADMRAVGHDQHLAVSFQEQLATEKNPTPEQKRRAQAFDLANGYGIRSARRLPGNIGYTDLAYFSPDPAAGTAIAAVMQIVNGTDALILDLRRNGGGSGETELTLLSYFFDDRTQLSSLVRTVNGKTEEIQHWTVPYVQGPRFTDKPIFILISRHTHSAAEVLSYDLQNLHRATTVGERTSGEATAGNGEVNLGYALTAFIPNGQMKSPITNGNYLGVGVQPSVSIAPAQALLTAYRLALQKAKWSVDSEEMRKERADALKNPSAALLQEIDGFPEQ